MAKPSSKHRSTDGVQVPDDSVTLIGWREYVELPDWKLHGVRAKADTGARSSAIDVRRIEELPGERVRFTVVTDRDKGTERTIVSDITRRTRIRSSFGRAHDRLFVKTRIALAGREVIAEVGLVSRRHMLCRMLIGRKTLEHVFIVDPSRAYVHGRRRRSKPTTRKQAN
jgi:hypothetical protein